MPTLPPHHARTAAGPPRRRASTRAQLKIEGGGEIPCWFNPKEYTVSKSNEWTVKPVVGAALPTAQFGGGQARELSLDLLFDASDSATRSVRDVCDELFRVMEVRPDMAAQSRQEQRPPADTSRSSGARPSTFNAVAKQLSVQYLLFRGDGRPIRAQAKLSLVQVEPAPGREPAQQPRRDQARAAEPDDGGVAGLRSHVVRDGDTPAVDRLRRLRRRDALAARSPRPTASTTRCGCRARRHRSRSRGSTDEPAGADAMIAGAEVRSAASALAAEARRARSSRSASTTT